MLLRMKSLNGKGGKLKDSPLKRCGYFINRRQEVVFGPEVCCASSSPSPFCWSLLLHQEIVFTVLICNLQDLVTTDFCYNFLTFTHDGILLKLPGSLSVEMTKYWDGRPVRFVSCIRLKVVEYTAEKAWGHVSWCVDIEPARDDDLVCDRRSTKSESSDGQASGNSRDIDRAFPVGASSRNRARRA